jgi:hypothetical protein
MTAYLVALEQVFAQAIETPLLLQGLWLLTQQHFALSKQIETDSIEEIVYKNLETIAATFFNNPADCSVSEYAWLTERCVNCWLRPDAVPVLA